MPGVVGTEDGGGRDVGAPRGAVALRAPPSIPGPPGSPPPPAQGEGRARGGRKQMQRALAVGGSARIDARGPKSKGLPGSLPPGRGAGVAGPRVPPAQDRAPVADPGSGPGTPDLRASRPAHPGRLQGAPPRAPARPGATPDLPARALGSQDSRGERRDRSDLPLDRPAMMREFSYCLRLVVVE